VITPEKVEYEVDILEGRTLRFDANCLAAWQELRAEELTPTRRTK
jgi:hypothetical protein